MLMLIFDLVNISSHRGFGTRISFKIHATILHNRINIGM